MSAGSRDVYEDELKFAVGAVEGEVEPKIAAL